MLSRATVVIVTWNSAHLIERCLEPFDRTKDRPRVVVYDNASTDETVALIEKRFSWVNLIAGSENIGFGRANNAALLDDDNSFYILLNPDAFVSSSSDLAELLVELDASPDVGSVGPMLLHGDGSHQVGDAGWATSIGSVAAHVFWLHRVFPKVRSIYVSNKRLLKRNTLEVDWICGACLVVRNKAWHHMGGFDDSIFMYGEDVDLGERLRKAGWRCLYVPRVKVTHLQGGTQGASEQTYYSAKWMIARAKRFAKNNGRIKYWILKHTLSIGYLGRCILSLFTSFRVSGKTKLYWRFSRDAFKLPSWQDQRAER